MNDTLSKSKKNNKFNVNLLEDNVVNNQILEKV